MQLRHEIKHQINQNDLIILRQRLGAVMTRDRHAIDGKYDIRSLYFDDPDDRALRDKLDGVKDRVKYRIRMYNHDASMIHLERKVKHGGLGYKEVVTVDAVQALRIAHGDIDWMARSDEPLIRDFYANMRNGNLTARTIVDYTREPFVFGPGNVRVTLDYNIRTALRRTDFLNPDCVTIPLPDSPCILEVKWDSYLPDVVRDIVQLGERRGTAFSKYAACRMYD